MSNNEMWFPLTIEAANDLSVKLGGNLLLQGRVIAASGNLSPVSRTTPHSRGTKRTRKSGPIRNPSRGLYRRSTKMFTEKGQIERGDALQETEIALSESGGVMSRKDINTVLRVKRGTEWARNKVSHISQFITDGYLVRVIPDDAETKINKLIHQYIAEAEVKGQLLTMVKAAERAVKEHPDLAEQLRDMYNQRRSK